MDGTTAITGPLARKEEVVVVVLIQCNSQLKTFVVIGIVICSQWLETIISLTLGVF